MNDEIKLPELPENLREAIAKNCSTQKQGCELAAMVKAYARAAVEASGLPQFTQHKGIVTGPLHVVCRCDSCIATPAPKAEAVEGGHTGLERNMLCWQHRPSQPCPTPQSCSENGCSAVERELLAATQPSAAVTDAMVEAGLNASIDASDKRLSRYATVRAIIAAALSQGASREHAIRSLQDDFPAAVRSGVRPVDTRP